MMSKLILSEVNNINNGHYVAMNVLKCKIYQKKKNSSLSDFKAQDEFLGRKDAMKNLII